MTSQIPKDWQETTLGKISQNITYGYTASASIKKVGPKFLRITDIQDDFVDWNTVPFCEISDKDYEKYKLKVGDILVARTGNSTGATTTIKSQVDAVFASYLIRFQLNAEKADYNFIDYLIRSRDWNYFIKGIKSKSAQDGANAQELSLFPINLPPLPEQKEIAAVLTSFDDKIELLIEENKTLEKIAQTIFDKFFSLNSSGNQYLLYEIIELNPKESIKKGARVKYFDMKTLSERDMSISAPTIRGFSSGSKFKNGDTLLARITPCLENGKTGFVNNLEENEVAFGSTEFIVMRKSNIVSPYFVYCLARNTRFRDFAIKSMSGTSGRQRVQVDNLYEFPISIDLGDINLFDTLAKDLFQKIGNNSKEINNLSILREVLLPKLMKGEIRV